jgi:acyl-CoA reductase-like NAD-dependent aldehyde dehydrogenase
MMPTFCCSSQERVICSDKIGDILVTKLTERMQKLSAGAESEGHKLPCLFREGAAAGVQKLLQDAVQAGGKLILGDLKRNGAIIQPHLIDHCPTDCDLFVHESFGPIITVTRVNGGIQAVIDLVNSSEYSLTNSVFGTNIEDCMTVAKEMRSGSAHINGPTVSVCPFWSRVILGRDESSCGRTWRT